jgi:beta-1,4-mannosyltransferase
VGTAVQPEQLSSRSPPRDGATGMKPNGVRVLAWPGFGARRTNAYTWLLYSHLTALGVRVRDFSIARALLGGYDILHVHWPEKALTAGSWMGTVAGALAALVVFTVAHLYGARIVWTAHNLSPHESRHHRLERWFWRAFVARVDAVIHLSHASRAAVEACYPVLAVRPSVVMPHGHFRGAYPDTSSRQDARASLGIPDGARVVSFVGTVRWYKNVPHLIRTFRALPGHVGDVILLVAGAPRTPALAREIRTARGGDPRVRLTLAHIPDDDLQRYLRAADLVVLPFMEITNSGSALLALSFDRPVLVPELGAMAELRKLAGVDWVRTYQGELTPDILAGALHWASGRQAARRPNLDPLDWWPIARQTLAAYLAGREVVPQARRPLPSEASGLRRPART